MPQVKNLGQWSVALQVRRDASWLQGAVLHWRLPVSPDLVILCADRMKPFGSADALKRTSGSSMQSFSQYGQDAIVDEFLRQSTAGFFLDIGAHDGITFSNSRFFEKYREWDGICVEANPEVYQRLKANRSCKTINVALAKQKGQVRFAKVSGYAEMLSGIVADYDPRHSDRIEREVKQHGGKIDFIDVPTLSVNELLDEYNVRTVDFCSIDTEGGELAILQGIDFGRFHFRTIAVENNYRSRQIRRLLDAAGFALLRSAACDEIYANVRELPQRTGSARRRQWFATKAKKLFGIS